jgi:hypothetical protein
MSVLNIWVERTRVLVLVDTKISTRAPERGLLKTGHGDIMHASKLLCVPHAGVLLAGRGHLYTVTNTLANVLAGYMQTLDDIEMHMPALLAAAGKGLVENARRVGDLDLSKWGQQLALVGWSPRRRAMVGIRWYCSAPTEDWVRAELEAGDYLSYWDTPTWGEAPVPRDASTMLTIARRQYEGALEEASGDVHACVVGGSALIAELTADTCITRLVPL